MLVSVIGLGKLGLCVACTLAKHYKVIGIDTNSNHVNLLRSGINPIKERNLDFWYMLYRKRITFTNRFDRLGKVVFIVVPTPSKRNGTFSSTYIENALQNISKKTTVVIVSTVMPGETVRLQRKYSHLNIIYSPTFIALGSVIENFLNPDFILVGTDRESGLVDVLKIYEKICLTAPSFAILSTLEAEITKLALNCYITTKITFANQIGNLCHRAGVPADNILRAIGKDKRVGSLYFKAGLGYGGPCFPRDNKAMSAYVRKMKMDSGIFYIVDYLNNAQIEEFVKRIIKLEPKTVGFESLSYKKGTRVTEASQLVEIYDSLKDKGYNAILGKGDVNVNWDGIV